MFQKHLLLDIDSESDPKSIKSTTKMGEQKLLQKLNDLLEENLFAIKQTKNLYLTNKIAKIRTGEYNVDTLLQNIKFICSLLVQELNQYQLQVDSQNMEPNKLGNQLKFDLQKSKYDNQQLRIKIKELEDQLFQQSQLNTSICQELVNVKQKCKEYQRKFQMGCIQKNEQTQVRISDISIKDKLQQLHKIFEISKESENQQNKKLTIMTEPCEQDNCFSGYYTQLDKNMLKKSQQKWRQKQNKTAESFSSISREETFDISESFSHLNTQGRLNQIKEDYFDDQINVMKQIPQRGLPNTYQKFSKYNQYK